MKSIIVLIFVISLLLMQFSNCFAQNLLSPRTIFKANDFSVSFKHITELKKFFDLRYPAFVPWNNQLFPIGTTKVFIEQFFTRLGNNTAFFEIFDYQQAPDKNEHSKRFTDVYEQFGAIFTRLNKQENTHDNSPALALYPNWLMVGGTLQCCLKHAAANVIANTPFQISNIIFPLHMINTLECRKIIIDGLESYPLVVFEEDEIVPDLIARYSTPGTLTTGPHTVKNARPYFTLSYPAQISIILRKNGVIIRSIKQGPKTVVIDFFTNPFSFILKAGIMPFDQLNNPKSKIEMYI